MDARTTVMGARRAAGISQREVARRSGVPQASISRIEAGLVAPRTSTLDRLLAACGRDLDLVGRAGTGVDRSLIRERLELSIGERARRAILEWHRTRSFDRSASR